MDTSAKVTDNERAILDIVRRHEPIVRSKVQLETPLRQPSVHRILESLTEKRLVTVGAPLANGPGKPSPEVSLDRTAHFSLGISVNTDEITVCLTNLACEPVTEATLVEASGNRDQALAGIKEIADAMLAEQNRTETDLLGVGLGISGFFVDGQVNAPEPLRDWSLTDLHAVLGNHFSVPTWVENNGATGAIGESLIGVGRWSSNFAYLSFNYGFGGGAIIDGKPWLGANGNALEISGLYTEEQSKSRPALRFLIDELQHNGVRVKTIEELRENFDLNWPGVENWIERSLPCLNQALWAIRAILDPEVVVFGGEIPEALAEALIERVTPYGYERHRYNAPIGVPKLTYTEASHAGPALGAALLPLKARLFA